MENNVDIKKFILNWCDGQKITFVPNPGNVGDAFITLATIQILKSLGIDYTIGKPWVKSKLQTKRVIYGGGGNLVPMYKTLKKFILANQDKHKILILPQTIFGCDMLLKNLSKNVTLFAREKKSYNYIKENSRFGDMVYISHDMAFNYSIKKKNSCEILNEEINSFRVDGESTDIKLPFDNVDLTRENTIDGVEFYTKLNEKNFIEEYVEKFETIVSSFTKINTNRLHVAIMGALYGREVNLYPNSYYKNKEVYEYSIKNKFSNVKFIVNS